MKICMLNGFEKVSTNEEYKLVVKSKMKTLIFLGILGLLSIIICIVNEFFHFAGDNDWMNSIYSGFGGGLLLVSIIRYLQKKKLLKDEAALKADRIRNQDERNIMISSLAMRTACLSTIAVCYVVMLILGFISKELFFCFWSIIMLFMLFYLTFYKIYERKI